MRSVLLRKSGLRELKKRIYIFTEGIKTEPNYFRSKKNDLRLATVIINPNGTGGCNTLSLVDQALNYIKENGISVFDECWVVFDRDSFDAQFDNAIHKAKANKLFVAYSNEAFELWYILHFEYLSSAITRQQYIDKLSAYLKTMGYSQGYKKNFSGMYDIIKEKEASAIKNAKKLEVEHGTFSNYIRRNPSTTIYLLIESMNSL